MFVPDPQLQWGAADNTQHEGFWGPDFFSAGMGGLAPRHDEGLEYDEQARRGLLHNVEGSFNLNRPPASSPLAFQPAQHVPRTQPLSYSQLPALSSLPMRPIPAQQQPSTTQDCGRKQDWQVADPLHHAGDSERARQAHLATDATSAGGKAVPARKKKKKNTKSEMMEGVPKKPATSFVLFSNTVRHEVKEANPGISFVELGKKMGAMWREMEPEAKRYYEEQASAATENYLAAKKSWLVRKYVRGGAAPRPSPQEGDCGELVQGSNGPMSQTLAAGNVAVTQSSGPDLVAWPASLGAAGPHSQGLHSFRW